MADDALPRSLGTYVLHRAIGEGGQGRVYEATEPRFAGPLAVKTLKRRSVEDATRLKREFRQVDGLDHPNLVLPYELDEVSGELFFSMPLVEGAQDPVTWTRRRLEAASSYDWSVVRDLLRQLASGLGALHERSVLHLDLKPSNVLVDARGRVRLLDFGLSSRSGSEERRASVIGTPGYLAPERLTQPASPASDVFAVGMLLFGMLTGQDPPRDFAWRADVGGLEASLSSAWPPVPKDLVGLCLSLCEPDPSARPSLDDLLEGLTPGTGEPPPPAPLPPVGRDAFVEDLLTLLAGRPDHPRLLLVEGPAGSGKSTVLGLFAAALREDPSVLLLETRNHERDLVAFKVLDAFAEPLADLAARHRDDPSVTWPARLARLLPALRSAVADRDDPATPGEEADPSQLREAYDALAEGLGALAGSRRLVVVIDDAQWGDADSALALAHAITGATPLPIDLVLAAREGHLARSPFLQRVLSHGGHRGPRSHVRRLPSLDAHHLAEIVRQLQPATPPDVLDDIVAASEGLPALAMWLTLLTAASGRQRGGGWRLTLASHLAALPPDHGTVLNLLAVSRGPLPAGVLKHAATEGVRLEDVLTSLKARRLVASAGLRPTDPIEIYHAHLSDVAEDALDPGTRARLHSALADAWIASPSPPDERVATHLVGAGRTVEAQPHLERAARTARDRLAYAKAAELVRVLLDCLPHGDPRRDAAQAQLASDLHQAGQLKDAAHVQLDRSLARARSPGADALRVQAAEWLIQAGWLSEGRAALVPLLPAAGLSWPSRPGAARWRLVWNLLALAASSTELRPGASPPSEANLRKLALLRAMGKGLAAVDPDLGGAYLLGALRLARRLGDPDAYAEGSAFFASLLAFSGSGPFVRWSHRVLAGMDALATSTRSTRYRGLHRTGLGIVATCEGRLTEARAALEEADALLRPHAGVARWERNIARGTHHLVLLEQGDLEALGPLASAAWHEGDQCADLPLLCDAGLYLGASLVASDHPADARDLITATLRRWKADAPQFPDWHGLRFRTFANCYEAHPAARSVLEAGFEELHAAGLTAVALLRYQGAMLWVATTPPGAAGDTKARVNKLVGRDADPRAAAARALAEVLVAADARDHVAVRAHLRASEAALRAAGLDGWAACVAWRAADLDNDPGARAAAQATLAAQGIAAPARWVRLVLPDWAVRPPF